MYFKTAICDDNITEINILTNYLKQYEIEYDIEFKTDLYSSADALIEKYISVGMYDLLFLDVEMPGKNGLDAASIIRQRGDRDVRIIFVSNYPEYMQDSFNVQAFHYLSKPLSYECFSDVISRIIKYYEESHTTKVLISEDNVKEIVNIRDILYIETVKSQKDTLHFVLKSHDIFCKGILNEWKSELADYGFVISYRGVLVNMDHIKYISNSSLALTNGLTIPLSRRYEKEIRTRFSKHILTLHHT